MKTLDYKLLLALDAVMQEQNFERAAQRLHITQSAISQRIKQLEVQLKQAQEKAQFFEAVIHVLKREHGVTITKKPAGKSSKKSSSKG